jgi:hypothetical protein
VRGGSGRRLSPERSRTSVLTVPIPTSKTMTSGRILQVMNRDPLARPQGLGRRLIIALVWAAALIVVTFSLGCSGDDRDPAQLEPAGEADQATQAWAAAARPWMQERLIDLGSDHLALLLRISEDWGTPRQRTLLEPAEDGCGRYQAALREVQAFPGGTSDLERMNAGFERAFGHFVNGCKYYVAGIRRGDRGLLDAGDEEFLLGQREVATMRSAADEITGPRPSLQQELDAFMDELRPIRITEAAALRSNIDMLDALERGQLRRAQEEAARVRRLFAQITSRLREISEPSGERLSAALESLRAGYALGATAFADFEQGIRTRRYRLLLIGDRKLRRSNKLVAEGAQSFIEVVRQTTAELP